MAKQINANLLWVKLLVIYIKRVSVLSSVELIIMPIIIKLIYLKKNKIYQVCIDHALYTSQKNVYKIKHTSEVNITELI